MKACINNWKNLLNSNISSTFPRHMANFGHALTAEIGWQVCGTPANFNGFRVLALLLHDVAQWRSTELGTIFAVSWTGSLHYIHFIAPNGILLGAIFTLRPSLAFSYIGRVTALHGICSIAFNRGCHLYWEGGHHVGYSSFC